MTSRFLPFLLLAALPLAAQNKLPNSSFELGELGYAALIKIPTDKLNAKAFLPEWDRQDKVHGSCSLKFPDPQGNSVEFFSPEFSLPEKDRTYTFSVWLKSDRQTNVTLQFFQVTNRKPDAMNRWIRLPRTVKVGTEWKRYEFTFQVPAIHHYGTVKLLWDSGVLQIDAMQVEAGKATAYSPAAPVEAGFAPAPESSAPGTYPLELRVFNNTDRIQDLTGTAAGQKISMKVPAGKTAVKELQVPFQRYGFFQTGGDFQCEAGKGKFLPHYRTVIHPLPTDKVDLEKTFTIGYSGPIAYRWDWGKSRFDFLSMEKSFAETCREVRQQGIRLLRLHDDNFTWPDIEPEPGKFKFDALESLWKNADANGLEVLPVLGKEAFLFLEKRDQFANWFLRKDTDTRPTYNGKLSVRPPMKAWERYCRALFRQFKGRIRYYEIINEPNHLQPKEYVPYLKTAFEVAREVDPSIKIVGLCSTGDLGGHLTKFLEGCGELGAYQWCDIVSFHPYDAQLDNWPVSAEEQIRQVRKIVDRFRPGLPLWNSELYYVHSREEQKVLSNGGNWINHGRIVPKQVVKRYLIDLGNGLAASIPLHGSQVMHKMHTHCDYGAPWSEARYVSSAIAAAGNAFAFFLEGSRPLRRLSALLTGINGYEYQTRGREKLAALWALEDDGVFYLEFPEQAELYDLYGNRIKGGKHTLTTEPVYLKGISPEKLKIRPALPYKFCGTTWTMQNGRPALAVEVLNNGKTPVEVKCRLQGLSASAQTLKLNGESSDCFLFPVPAETKQVGILLAAEGKQQKFTVTAAPKKVVRAGEKLMLGKSAECILTVTEQALVIDLSVRDKKRGPRIAHQPWTGDSVELFLDAAPDKRLDFPYYTPSTYRLFLMPASANGLPAEVSSSANLNSKQIQWKLNDSGTDYQFRLEIPWSALGLKKAAPVAFDCKVNDADENGKVRSVIWAGNNENWKYRTNFGKLVLE